VTSELTEFLAAHPPWNALPRAELEQVLGWARARTWAAGTRVLVEDGPPARSLWVVRTGAMELLHEDEVIDVLEPGESFGQLSLLSGEPPSFTVRAHLDSTGLEFPRSAAQRAFERPEGAQWLARSLRERLVRTGRTVHALPELHGGQVADLVRREPLWCEAGEPVEVAARRITEHGVSGVLVELPDGLGIVTDRELREHVLAAGLPGDTPVGAAARVPAPSIPADRLVGDAVTDLLEADEGVLCVERDGSVLGLVTAEEILGHEAHPFRLRRALAGAPDRDALVAAARDLPALFIRMHEASLPPVDIGRVLTLCRDTCVSRLIDFAFERDGEAPRAWAWMALGSGARRELTLASDFDNALAYADGPEAERAGVDRFFHDVAAYVNSGLAAAGFGEDTGEVLATSPNWRMTAAEWEEAFRRSLAHPDRSGLVRAAVAFDFRIVAGGLDIAPPLTEILRTAPDHPDFLARLARTVLDFRPPLGGLRRSIRAGDSGVDLKQGGSLPIANIARWYALANGITVSSTLDRLLAAEATGVLDAPSTRSLVEAFNVVTRLRIAHQAAQAAAGAPIDNCVDPRTLPPLVHAELREAFRAVADIQKRLSVYGRGIGR
jgi:CBS domain-containing protein